MKQTEFEMLLFLLGWKKDPEDIQGRKEKGDCCFTWEGNIIDVYTNSISLFSKSDLESGDPSLEFSLRDDGDFFFSLAIEDITRAIQNGKLN